MLFHGHVRLAEELLTLLLTLLATLLILSLLAQPVFA